MNERRRQEGIEARIGRKEGGVDTKGGKGEMAYNKAADRHRIP